MILANPIEAEMILLDQQLKQLLDTGNMVVGFIANNKFIVPK